MTSRLKTTLASLVAMAKSGNTHAVPALQQILDATADPKDRQQVRLAIAHAEGRHAPKATPALNPAVAVDLDAETARRWALVRATK